MTEEKATFIGLLNTNILLRLLQYHDGAHLEWYAEYEDRGGDVGEDGLVEAGGEV